MLWPITLITITLLIYPYPMIKWDIKVGNFRNGSQYTPHIWATEPNGTKHRLRLTQKNTWTDYPKTKTSNPRANVYQPTQPTDMDWICQAFESTIAQHMPNRLDSNC